MNGDSTDSSERHAQSPNIERPPNMRHLSEDLQTYIDLYGINSHVHETEVALSHAGAPTSESGSDHDFLDQELKNLQNLRRLSLDVSNVDPDLPSQNYELKPAIQPQVMEDESETTTNSLYWVPARIHPEIAPQEWQSFVQKRSELKSEDDTAPGVFRAPSLKRGLSRSRSLLSREITDRGNDQFKDAGPELERRRSKLRPAITVNDLMNVTTDGALVESPSRLQGLVVPEESAQEFAKDEPILVPPPGQILRRAARTGKAKGSYRKFAKPKSGGNDVVEETSKVVPQPSPSGFESETINLREDARGSDSALAPANLLITQATQDLPLERTKSRNRTVQIVGPKSPIDALPAELSIANARVATDDAQKEKMMLSDGAVKSAGLNDTETLNDKVKVPQIISTNIATTKTGPPPGHEAPAAVQKPTVLQVDSKELDSSRPGLKRELSAASLTRAVMSGAAPGPAAATSQSPARKQNQEDPVAPSVPVVTGKKSAWGKLFSSDDKSKVKKEGKTSSKMKRTPSQEDRSAHEKDMNSNNLFSSIFGVKKKEKEAITDAPRRSSNPTPKNVIREPRFYSRYPIQLERAIYRMAHLKLGNSRRPLFHQVLLSNFMYGYLALVGANTSGQSQGPARKNRQQAGAQRSSSSSSSSAASSVSSVNGNKDVYVDGLSEKKGATPSDSRPQTADSSLHQHLARDGPVRSATSDFVVPEGAQIDAARDKYNLSVGHVSSGNTSSSDANAAAKPAARLQRPGPVRRTGSMDPHEIHGERTELREAAT